MYHRFYNLATEPFRLSPDHRFCYKHRSYGRAKTYMTYALDREEGFVVVTGEPGTGKSTLIEDLFADLKSKPVVRAKLVSTQLEGDELLRMVAFAFDIEAAGLDKATLISRLSGVLLKHRRAGCRALLVVDEAQDLSHSALEELRLLTNLQQDSVPLLQIFLVGQQELRDMIRDKSMEQMHQRIIAACHLESLKVGETRAYVEHRLVCSGWKGDPCISDAAFYMIHQFSAGVPRRINLVCSRLFLHGSVEERHQLLVADVREVLQELHDEKLDPLGDGSGGIDNLVADIPTGLRDECTPSMRSAKTAQKPTPAAPVRPEKGQVGKVRALHADPAHPVRAPVVNLPDNIPAENFKAPGNKVSAENSPVKKIANQHVLVEVENLLDDLGKSDNQVGAQYPPVKNTLAGDTRKERPTKRAAPAEARKPPPSVAKTNALDYSDPLAGERSSGRKWLSRSAMFLFIAALIAFVIYALNVIYEWNIDFLAGARTDRQSVGIVEIAEKPVKQPSLVEQQTLPAVKSEGVRDVVRAPDRPAGELANALPVDDAEQPAAVQSPAENPNRSQDEALAEPGTALGNSDASPGQDATARPSSPAWVVEEGASPVIGSPESAANPGSTSNRRDMTTVNSSDRSQTNLPAAGETDQPEGQDPVTGVSGRLTTPSADSARLAGDPIGLLESELRQFPFYINRLDDGSLEVDLANTVSFAFDSAEFDPSSGEVLDKLAGALKPYTEITLRVVGHTDSTGPESYNLLLSRRRAAAVAAYLNVQRVGGRSRVQVEGRGESEPVAPGEPERNRRIVVYIAPVHQG